MKKLKGMDYTLTLGTFILFFGGIGMLFNEAFSRMEYKLIGVSIVAILLYLLSYVFNNILKMETSFKSSFVLGNLAIIFGYGMAGVNGFFGSWFCIDGEGVQLFLASLALLVGILSILTKVFLKNANYIHITFISILVMVFHLLSFFEFDYQVSLIIIGSILLVLNLCKFSKILYKFTNIAIYVFALLCVIFGFDGSFLLSSILVGINVIALINLLYKYKTVENELLSYIIIYYTIARFAYISYDNFDAGLVTVTLSFILCILDLCNNTFQVINSKFVKVIYKISNLIFLTIILFACSDAPGSQLIASGFMIINSIINSYIIKNDDFEVFALPFKMCLIALSLNNFISGYVEDFSVIYIGSILSVLLVLVYNIIQDKRVKPIYLILNILLLLTLSGEINEGILAFIFLMVSYVVCFIGLKPKSNALASVLFSFIAILLLSMTDAYFMDFSHSLIILLVSAIFAYLNKDRKYNYVISIALFMYVFAMFIDFTIADFIVVSIIVSLVYYLILAISSEILFSSRKGKNIFITISYLIIILSLLSAEEMIINFYSLIASLIFIIVGLKSDEYKSLYYIGLISGILNIVALLRYLDGIPVAVYFIIISILLITVVSIMVYKYQKKIEDRKANNRCPNCNEPFTENQSFCGKCGTKIK